MGKYDELKRLAEAATPFMWGSLVDASRRPGEVSNSFMKAANPAAVLALIAENAATESRLHEVAVACATAEQERDQLKAENSRLRQIISDSATACGAAMSPECTVEFMGHLPAEIAGVLGQLRAELERLRAERSAMASALMRIVDLSNSGHGPIRAYRQMLDIAAEARRVLGLEVANG